MAETFSNVETKLQRVAEDLDQIASGIIAITNSLYQFNERNGGDMVIEGLTVLLEALNERIEGVAKYAVCQG